MQPRHIIISRADSIGDVVLTLPLTGILKQSFPEARITFIGQPYTQPVIEACPFVDVFLTEQDFLKTTQKDWEKETVILHVFPKKEIAFHARRLGLKVRVGTKSRWYHWLNCNRLIHLKRRKSNLHEAQLNAKLLGPLGIKTNYTEAELAEYLSLDQTIPLPPKYRDLLAPKKRHVILHPKSKGSAIEWGLDQFAQLANALDPDEYQIFVSGTAAEQQALAPFFQQLTHPVTDLTGQLSLQEFMAFIQICDALVANSTGPLHIAGALGKQAIGLYPSIRPMHAGRWAPLGKYATAISASDQDTGMESIKVATVVDALEKTRLTLNT